eukprot:832590-Pyramimonas_sp.AAC.1
MFGIEQNTYWVCLGPSGDLNMDPLYDALCSARCGHQQHATDCNSEHARGSLDTDMRWHIIGGRIEFSSGSRRIRCASQTPSQLWESAPPATPPDPPAGVTRALKAAGTHPRTSRLAAALPFTHDSATCSQRLQSAKRATRSAWPHSDQ